MTQVRRSDNERGFALLIVFLLAAVVALMLYQQLPRVAFESQREKEQLLIDRGEQYKRAIQMYFVAFKKYPSKIEDLENTNNKRFLRRRYIDPMTGKDEWRLIHVNAAGQLTDSQVQKPPSPDDKNNPQNAANANSPGGGLGTNTGGTNTGGTATGGTASPGTTAAGTTAAGTGNAGTGVPGTPGAPPEVNAAVLRRPSDRPLIPASGINQNVPTADPNDPRNWPPIFLTPAQGTPGAQPGGQPVPGQQQLGQQQFPAQQYPGQQYPGQNPTGLPGNFQPGLQGQIQVPGQTAQFPGQNGLTPLNPGQTNPINQNQVTPIVAGQGFNQQGFNQQGFNQQGAGTAPTIPGGGSNPAVGMINDMLRQPRQAADSGSAFNNTLAAGGLAGVASSYKGPSIKVYKDRQKYNEWEFIFDLKQGLPGQQQTPGQQGQGLAPSGQGPTGPTPTATPPTTGFGTPTPTQPNQPLQ